MAELKLKHAILCPAAEEQHPVLSPNAEDVQCRIQGALRPSPTSPCCNDYTRCPIWRRTREVEWTEPSQEVLSRLRSPMHRHTMRHATRDSIRA